MTYYRYIHKNMNQSQQQQLLLNDHGSDSTSNATGQLDPTLKGDIAEQDAGPQFKLYPMRWVVLFFFAMSELLNTVVYPVCNPIAPEVGRIYGESAGVVTLTATLFLFMHPAFTFPASYTIINKGVAFSVKLGALLTIIGTSVRCLCLVSRYILTVFHISFYWILLGQTLSGIGRPFILNSQASIAQNWFPIEQRTQIITFLNFTVTFSGILGLLIPSIFFQGYNGQREDDDAPDYVNGHHRFRNLLLLELIGVLMFMVPLLFIIKSSPPTPPSHFANKTSKINFRDSLKGLFHDTKFIFIFVSFSIFFGTFKGFSVALPYLLSPFNYHSTDIAILASMPIVGGFCSSMVVPGLYKRWKKYKPLLLVMQVFTIVSYFLLYYTCYVGIFWVVLIDTFFLGFFMIPSIPMNIEWSCKQTYPINDSFCIGIMYSGATLSGSLIGQMLTYVSLGNQSTKSSSLNAFLTINGMYAFAMILTLTVREIKSKNFISIHQSFHSLKVIQGQGGTMIDNTDIFETFPHACPEGDPEFYFDITPFNNKASVLSENGPRSDSRNERVVL